MAQRRREEHRTAAMARGTGREKDRDRDKEREREKDRDREKERVREKEKEERDKDKGKERDREKEKERISVKDKEEREKEKGKERDRDKEKERDREKGDTGKDKDRDRAKEREKERELDKERQRERDKERQRERERERELERDRQKLKQKERDNDRDRGRERERDNERERDRERDRDNERDRGRERDIERDRQKYKQRDKDRDQDAEKKEDREKPRDDREKGHKGLQGSANAEKEKDRQRQKQDSEKWGEKDRHRDDREKSSKEAQLATTEFEDKIARIREERLKSNVDKRSSRKAEPEKPLDEDNISAWVVKTRKLEIEKAARMAKILSEQDNEEEDEGEEGTKNAADIPDTSSLAGLRVRHGFDKVMEGGAVVLTLKDTNILAGDDVNEEGDELENIEMAEQKQREDAYKAAKKKPGTYEDKFINDIAGVRSILPQYDDAVKEEGLVLDESGGVSEESKQRLEEIRQKLQGIGSRMEQSLNSKAVAADFYTEEEMLQFKKPKTKRKLRKKDKLDIYALEAEAAASGIGAQDHGSRASGDIRAVKRAEEEEIADKRKNAYQNALSKAVDASKVLQGTNTIDQMQVDEEVPAFGAEEDDELHRSLERSRQASLKKQSESAMAGPQGLAAQLAALRQSSGEASQVGEGDDKKDLEDKKLVFTDTGEFCRSLQLDEAITRRAGTKDAFGEEDEEPPSSAMEEDVPAGGGWTEVKEAAKVPGSGEDAGEEKEELEAPIKETSVGKGLAGALQLLQERGTLRETIDWGGRNMDKKRSKLVGVVEDPKPQAAPQPAREIILDRVDEFGRTMTPKEAFRKLSHKFHGKGPGKMKQEKRMKQHQEELKLKQMNSGDTPLMSMEKIREAQANLHSPYIVISGHIKPGQTSDPRSGFATVEKEPIGSLTPMLGDKNKVGSLTPMLGDKKVEHFLGIKRKHDNGSMGPPPPKKPKADQ